MPTLQNLTQSVEKSLYKTNYVNRFFNKYAFAAIKDGSVVAWGDPISGGDISTRTGYVDNSNVIKIVSSFHSFVALKSDGYVFAWGQVSISNSIKPSLTGITQIIPNGKDTYACIKADGTIVTFGNSRYGGNVIISTIPRVLSITATTGAFASLSEDRSVYAWGDNLTGGLLTSSPFNIEHIIANRGAFAALSITGQVYIWGNAAYGGTVNSNILGKLSSDVAFVFANPRSFVALKKDSSLVSWGEESSGGFSPLEGGTFFRSHPVISVVANGLAYAAVMKDGSSTRVQTWGDDRTGGDITIRFDNINRVFANDHAFAAISTSGTIISWGEPSSGGNSSGVKFKEFYLNCKYKTCICSILSSIITRLVTFNSHLGSSSIWWKFL